MEALSKNITSVLQNVKAFIKEQDELEWRKEMCEKHLIELKTIAKLIKGLKELQNEFGWELYEVTSDLEDLVSKNSNKRKSNEINEQNTNQKKSRNSNILDEYQMTHTMTTIQENNSNSFQPEVNKHEIIEFPNGLSSSEVDIESDEKKMFILKSRASFEKRMSAVSYSYDLPDNLTHNEILCFFSIYNKKPESFEDMLAKRSKNFRHDIISNSLQIKTNSFKTFAEKYAKQPGTCYTQNVDKEFKTLLEDVEKLRTEAFKKLCNKHDIAAETKSMNEFLKDVPVSNSSTILNSEFYIRDDVPKAAIYLDKRNAKTEEISDVLAQAHILLGKEAKVGMSNCTCHQDEKGEKFLVCKRNPLEAEYEVIKGSNILFLGDLSNMAKTEMSVKEHSTVMGIACNKVGDNPTCKKMSTHGLSNGLTLVYYAPLKHADHCKRFIRALFPVNDASSLMLAIKSQMNCENNQVGCCICLFCKKIINQLAHVHKLFHTRPQSTCVDNHLIFDTRDPVESMLDTLSRYKKDSGSSDMEKIFDKSDKLYIDMYLFYIQYYNTGFHILSAFSQDILAHGNQHILKDCVFYSRDASVKGGKKMYHQAIMLENYFYSQEYKDCLKEILISGEMHHFMQ